MNSLIGDGFKGKAKRRGQTAGGREQTAKYLVFNLAQRLVRVLLQPMPIARRTIECPIHSRMGTAENQLGVLGRCGS
jgi:hypothetical protein